MRCKKVKRLLPLFVGHDLSAEKMSEMEIHLDECSACRKEYESYEVSLTQTKEWLAGEKKDWQDQEWQSAIRRSIEEQPARFSPLIPWPFMRSWAYVLMALLVIVLTIFVVRPGNVDLDERTGIVTSKTPSGLLTQEPRQQVVSLTMVSNETGLKVAWFFNKDFDFKEEK